MESTPRVQGGHSRRDISTGSRSLLIVSSSMVNTVRVKREAIVHVILKSLGNTQLLLMLMQDLCLKGQLL